MPFKVKDLMIDVTSLTCPQHTLVGCGVCSYFHPSYCFYGCTIHFSCHLGCSIVAPSQCTFQSQTITFTPTTCPGGSGDPTPTIVQNTPQYTGPQLAGLKDSLRQALAAAETAEKGLAEQLRPQSVADIELLESKMHEALDELKAQKANLQKKK